MVPMGDDGTAPYHELPNGLMEPRPTVSQGTRKEVEHGRTMLHCQKKPCVCLILGSIDAVVLIVEGVRLVDHLIWGSVDTSNKEPSQWFPTSSHRGACAKHLNKSWNIGVNGMSFPWSNSAPHTVPAGYGGTFPCKMIDLGWRRAAHPEVDLEAPTRTGPDDTYRVFSNLGTAPVIRRSNASSFSHAQLTAEVWFVDTSAAADIKMPTPRTTLPRIAIASAAQTETETNGSCATSFAGRWLISIPNFHHMQPEEVDDFSICCLTNQVYVWSKICW